MLSSQLAVPPETRAENPAGNGAAARAGAARVVQRLVDDDLPKLGMSAHVEVVVVPRNELMMSVEPMEGEARFRLSVDESFLQDLSADELSATVAHELGHVWIFTHHPFLQTEAGANDVAMRLSTISQCAQFAFTAETNELIAESASTKVVRIRIEALVFISILLPSRNSSTDCYRKFSAARTQAGNK